MPTIDPKKELKHLYFPSKRDIVLVDVPSTNFFMINGSGDPSTSESYQQALEALYGVTFTLKFDLTVMPLEGLWWIKGRKDFDMENKDN